MKINNRGHLQPQLPARHRASKQVNYDRQCAARILIRLFAAASVAVFRWHIILILPVVSQRLSLVAKEEKGGGWQSLSCFNLLNTSSWPPESEEKRTRRDCVFVCRGGSSWCLFCLC